ncbi:hypothetical protein V491_04767, partial [Pseudogymnoascus sp. VKM F-3775]
MAYMNTQNGVPGTANNVQTGHAKDGRSSSPGLAPPAYTAIDDNNNQPNEAQVLEQSSDSRAAEADITWAFTKLQIRSSTDGFPTPETSLAHLKLLEAFYSLKDEVAYSDGAFGLFDSRAPGTEESVAGDMEATKRRLEALAQIREKRWALYVVRAVDRFEVWWTKVLVPRDIAHAERFNPKLRVGRLKTTDIEDVGCWNNFVNNPTVAQLKWEWTRDMLPPLDVLMVWHSFMLNPRNYLEDCMRFGLQNTWYAGMPWEAVNGSINDHFYYEVTDEAKTLWSSATNRPWDNLEEGPTKMLKCPQCGRLLNLPWTTAAMPESAQAGWDMKFVGGGFGERDLKARCNGCQFVIDHDVLRVAKFKNDAEDLLLHNYPMGGTIVPGKGGTPLVVRERGRSARERRAIQSAEPAQSFPNRLIKEHLRIYVLALCTTDAKTSNLADIRNFIETAVNDTNIIAKVNNYKSRGSLFSAERLAVRHMMSRYWCNSSLFSMELSSAVMRQGSFVDKMHKIDWLHSPTAIATMQRLLVKYDRFFRIMASNPTKTAVPTLDVDLAWHTHQLSPKDYYSYSIRMTIDRFIDHDDKIDEEKLSDGFEWTSKEYQKLYGAVYSECTCWYCEAIRAKHVSSANSLFKTTSKHEKIADHFYDSGAAEFCPADKSAHISAHNAVPLAGDPRTQKINDRVAEARRKQLDEFYEKACKRAIKRGRPVPKKEQFVADHYGMAYASPYPYGMMYMS